MDDTTNRTERELDLVQEGWGHVNDDPASVAPVRGDSRALERDVGCRRDHLEHGCRGRR